MSWFEEPDAYTPLLTDFAEVLEREKSAFFEGYIGVIAVDKFKQVSYSNNRIRCDLCPWNFYTDFA